MRLGTRHDIREREIFAQSANSFGFCSPSQQMQQKSEAVQQRVENKRDSVRHQMDCSIERHFPIFFKATTLLRITIH